MQNARKCTLNIGPGNDSISQGVVGVTKALFVNFPLENISTLQKYLLVFLNDIHIWQVSQQLSQIRTWYSIENPAFWSIKKKKKTGKMIEIG